MLIWLIALMPVAWFLQNVLHEASHLFAGWLVEGRKPLRLTPWPNKQSGRWTFASYLCGPATKEGSPAWRHIAPLLFSLTVSPFLFAGLVLLGHVFFLPFWLCCVLDAVVWLFGYHFNRPGTDGAKFRAIIS